MSYKNQPKNAVYEVPGDEIAELLSMPDAIRTYMALGFIRPGLASWGKEVIYISPSVCEQMAFTLKGKPMTLEHPAGLITAENRDKFMIGAVVDVRHGDDGAFDARYYIDPKTKDGEEAIAACDWNGENPPRIKHVSCVYQVQLWGDGGSLNGVPYDKEVLAGTMLQLALTEDPRYDGTFIVRNSNDDIDRVEFRNTEGGLDSQIKNDYNENNKPKGATMSLWKKEKVEVDMNLMVDTDLGPKTIADLVQIANSSKETAEKITALETQIANSEKEKADKKKEEEDGQPKNGDGCGKNGQPKNADEDGDDKDKDGKDKESDQPKNSNDDLDAQEAVLNAQIHNGNDKPAAVENNVYAGMARAEADFAQK